LQAVNDLTVRQTPALPRPLTPEMIRRVVTGMGARDRLIVEWAVTTGARRMEIAGLALASLPRADGAAMPTVRLEETKGGKARSVYPPGPLLDRTWAYVREERAVAVRKAKARHAGYADPGALFVTDQGRILPRKYTGLPAHYQRQLNRSIKRARQMLLMK